MAKSKNEKPVFLHDAGFDPLIAAVRGENKDYDKKKAGFYLSNTLLERFDKVFYTLKIEGNKVDNKSALVELLLKYGLDVLEKKGFDTIK